MSVIIGLCGYKRTGKTTVAEILCDRYGYFHESFASPIREFVATIVGTSVHGLEAVKEAPLEWLDGKTPRHMMQTVGTEWGRDTVHPELWVRSLVKRIAPAITRHQPVVVSDVRFPNEAEALRSLGGIIVRVTRPGMTRGTHPSETQVDAIEADFEFPNNGGLMAALDAVDALHARVKR